MLEVQRQIICRVMIVLPFIVLLAGCAEYESETNYKEVKLEPGQVKQIKIGQTTQAEVESLLGKPTGSIKSHGRTEMCYSNRQLEKRHMVVNEFQTPGMGVVPIIAAAATTEMLFGKSKFSYENIIIVIGKDGYVEDIKRTGLNSHSTGLLVKDDYPHPDFTKADQIQLGVTTEEQVNTLLGAPPLTSSSRASNNSHFALWLCETGQFSQLVVSFRQDGTVDEVSNFFKGARWFPLKRVDADKVAQIKEQQSTRKSAESIFGRPQGISRNVQGSFYTYYIQVGKTKEEVYIQYDNSGVITRLIRKPLPE